MSNRRTQVELAKDARARVVKERAKLELTAIKARREIIKFQMSTYRAAKIDRSNRDWLGKTTSADSAIIADLPRLIARSRQECRDNAYAQSCVRAFRRNVIGTGINPSFAAGDNNGNLYGDFNRKANAQFYDWGRRPVDLENRRTLLDVQHWAVSELVTAGEAIIIRLPRIDEAGHKVLKVRCVESEMLDLYKLQHGDNWVKGGIEVDADGRPVAYHIYKHHPYDVRGAHRSSPIMLESERWPARFVSHIFDPERVLQTRGVTRFASVLQRLRDLAEFDASTLQAARAEANIGLIFKTEAGVSSSINFDGLNSLDIGPNDEVVSHTPTRPGNTYEPFVKAQLRAIAAGMGIGYEQIARDFTGGTYSSQRQGMLEDRREFEPLQHMIIRTLLQPIAEDWLFWEVNQGRIDAPLYAIYPGLYEYIKWRGQGWAWVDPQKQATGIQMMLELGLTTKEEQAMELGRDWQELADQRAAEHKYETEKGLAQPVKPSTQPTLFDPQAQGAAA